MVDQMMVFGPQLVRQEVKAAAETVLKAQLPDMADPVNARKMARWESGGSSSSPRVSATSKPVGIQQTSSLAAERLALAEQVLQEALAARQEADARIMAHRAGEGPSAVTLLAETQHDMDLEQRQLDAFLQHATGQSKGMPVMA
eukprot:GHRQ01015237.1.p2 GENE.GHRQ01015237.1~~GHRQ01015237.1.p2  ORF type:complete len:144 (+),score=67.75 GHRQ01015237.1:322-753(+)